MKALSFEMFKRVAILLALVLFVVGGMFTSYSMAESPQESASFIVKLAPGLTPEEEASVISANGGRKVSSIPALRLHVIEIPLADLSTIIQNYQNDNRVISIEENKRRSIEAITTDIYYSTEQWALKKIGWESVFGTYTPAGTSKVAVLDTGVDASHPELQGRVIDGMSVFDNSKGLTDPHGHGTWLSGIVAAATDNNEGIAGVAYSGVKILPVTVISPDGTGLDSDIIQGVIWAADNGADVILMGFSNPGFSSLLQEAIDYAWSKGAVLVASTGNEGLNQATFPAGHRGVIGVSATDADDNLASFSNYGEAAFLAAPGVEIAATDLGNDYLVISGTSPSAAIVAGVAAFMKAVDPTLTNGIIVGRLARTADPAGTQEQTGNGRINMARALEDTSMDEIQPAGAPEGGPYVGPYIIAAPKVGSVTVGTQSPNPVTAGSSATYTITINRGTGSGSSGSFTANLSITTTLPTGATAYFSPNPVSFAPTDNSKTATLTISTTTSTPGGTTTFTVKAETSATDFATGNGTLNVEAACTAPSITTHPTSQTVTYGVSSVSFSASASGTPTPTVQWQVSTNSGATWTDIIGATSTTLTIASPTVSMSGYQYRAVFTNDCGTATSNAATLTVNKANQTITVTTPAPATAAYNSTFNVAATASSGLDVAITTSGVCSGSGTGSAVITMTSGTGTCTVHYNQSGNDNYNAAPEVTSDTTATKIGQTITVTTPAPATAAYNSTFNVAATASSGLDVAITVSGVCEITSGGTGSATIKMTSGTGICSVYFNQAGNDNYNAAPEVTSETTATKIGQTITVTTPAPATAAYNSTFNVAATASSGLDVAITVSGVCEITSGGTGSATIKMTSGTGICSVYFNQAGNDNYNAAPQVTSDTTATKVNTTTTLSSSANPSNFGQAVTFTATVSNGGATPTGAVQFKIDGVDFGTAVILSGGSANSDSISTLIPGSYTIRAEYSGDSNYNGSTRNMTQIVNPASTTSTVTVSPNPQQYSDRVTFTATLSPASINGNAPATHVTFYVGTQNMGGCTLTTNNNNGSLTCSLANIPLLENPHGNGQMAPGSRTVTAVFSGINPNFAVNDATTTLTINREDARAEYIGDTYVSTGSATSSTATVLLAATIRDITAVNSVSDPDAGDIRNARVTFVNRDTNMPISGCTNLPVGLVNPSDTKTGTVSCNWTVNIGSADSVNYTIGIIVNHYYTRDNAEDNTVITVSKSMNNFITGGGYINITNSSGICPAATGSKTNFGFNVKYNKSLTNLQGNMNIIIRSATSCTPGYSGPRVYQIKANAMNNLTVNSANGTATFTSKANITDVTDPYNPIPLFGNGTLRVTMDDNGEPGRTDTIGITFHNSSGGLWFSSNWDGTKTVEQTLGGGNLVVR